ncbi:MAG TPA: DUF6787 family protein [Bacteroidales bacterium]
MKKFWNKLKTRWGITSDFQVAIILLVFTLTGFSTLYVNKLIDIFLGINEGSPLWQRILVFLIIVLPVYNLLLLFWGTVLGQFKFFYNFIKNFLKRIFFIKKKGRH